MSSPTPSFRPFDQRFQSRIASPYLSSPRPSSPAFLGGHSRNISLSSQLLLDPGETDTPSAPWEVVRWTKLKKLNGQVFSEAGRRNFGTPTCLAVSASIVLGTSKGIILVFDYNQNLKMIIGPGTKGLGFYSALRTCLTADLSFCSCRIWSHHRNRDIRRPHYYRRRARKWQHIYLGHLAGCETIPQYSASGPITTTEQGGRWSCTKRGSHSSWLSRHSTHGFGLRRRPRNGLFSSRNQGYRSTGEDGQDYQDTREIPGLKTAPREDTEA